MSKQSYSFAYGPLKIKGELEPTSTKISAKYSIVEDSCGDRIIGEKSTSLLDSEPFIYSGEGGTFTSTLGLQGTAIMAHVEGDIYDTTLAIIEKIADIELEPS
ncbi:hypothetical protein PENFLA_c048G02220 [Penicillium flavigenum]|uniref:Uncharacterized protein n=1 Tax=Penicillium flavigenum TaxID=254877 RepID=A0A1V6SIP3_9EURO|nr:hypothetical protein PENFLA_c048G02220 [Penicillium flavigenum]